jgi:membrane protease YdiL (CAAX protease family)
MAVELAMVVAALGLGIAAIVRTRRAGGSVLDLMGLRWSAVAARDLLAGMAITGVAMAGVYGAEAGLGVIAVSPAAPASPGSLLGLAAIKLAFTFKEELMMRSLLLAGLLVVLRGRAALAIGLSALAFGCIHLTNPGASALSVLSNSMGGVIYGLAFVLAGNLWLPIGLHFAWNFVQGPLLGFPVSGLEAGGLQHVQDLVPAWLTGGSYGPEGGIIGIMARFVVMALLLLWTGSRMRARAVSSTGQTAVTVGR